MQHALARQPELGRRLADGVGLHGIIFARAAVESSACLRTPTESRNAITAWLCVRCGYFETGGRVGRDIVSLPTRL